MGTFLRDTLCWFPKTTSRVRLLVLPCSSQFFLRWRLPLGLLLCARAGPSPEQPGMDPSPLGAHMPILSEQPSLGGLPPS